LEDLTTNDRFQISNLTVIAKENTEHALAISRVLENHIKSVGLSLSLSFAVWCRPLTVSVDTAATQAAGSLCSRFHRQERWDPLHSLPGTEHVSDLHECVLSG
jgi:hypothetical protein